MLDCHLEKTPGGWYLTFPHDLRAGLLLNTSVEQTTFAAACGIPAADICTIHKCPKYYYEQALNFKPCPF